MKLANEEAETALAALSKLCSDVQPDGPWRWRCAVQNGTRLPVSARFADGFLRLESLPEGLVNGTGALTRAAALNAGLTGGVKIAARGAMPGLKLCTDIVVLDEVQLAKRLEWSFDGFHECSSLTPACEPAANPAMTRTEEAPLQVGQDVLDNIPWQLDSLESGEYSVTLDADAARPARVRFDRGHTSARVDLIHADAGAQLSRQALACYLLAATGALRFVRACCVESEARSTYSLSVVLPAEPKAEELDHALAALSAAHRLCAREATVLLDETVAGHYLAVRAITTCIATETGEEKQNGKS